MLSSMDMRQDATFDGPSNVPQDLRLSPSASSESGDDKVIQLLELYISCNGDIDLKQYVTRHLSYYVDLSVAAVQPRLDLRGWNPFMDSCNRIHNFVSDCSRVMNLRKITYKAFQNLQPVLPVEVIEYIIDILRAEWLRIPYTFSASSVRRVWSVSREDAQKTGDFVGFVIGDNGYTVQENLWNERLQRWECGCISGAKGVLKWDMRLRRWRCGEMHRPACLQYTMKIKRKQAS